MQRLGKTVLHWVLVILLEAWRKKYLIQIAMTQKNSNLWNDVEYIFVNPANSSPKPKSKKELMIDSCLNDLGIFQVNIGVALKEYKL